MICGAILLQQIQVATTNIPLCTFLLKRHHRIMFGMLRSLIALACMFVITLPVSAQRRDDDIGELRERIMDIEEDNRQRDVDLDDLRQAILDEIGDRLGGDADLRDRILEETGNRQEGDLEVARQVIGEITARLTEDGELRKEIVDESAERIKEDGELREIITGVTRPDPGDAVFELEQRFDDFVRDTGVALAELEEKLAQEEADRKEADEKLQRAIDNLLNGDPAAVIDSPNGGEFFYSDYTGGADANGRYVEVNFKGQAVDLEDGELDGASMQWTTDQFALQPGGAASIGEGKSFSAKLYHDQVDCYFDGNDGSKEDNFNTHLVTLIATDSGGRTAEATIEINVAWAYCLI